MESMFPQYVRANDIDMEQMVFYDLNMFCIIRMWNILVFAILYKGKGKLI